MKETQCQYEAFGQADNGKTHYRCTSCDHERESGYPPQLLHRHCPALGPLVHERALLNGSGTELKEILTKMGLSDDGDCGCGSHMVQMNTNGTKWCHENIETIEGWMREAAEKRGLLFVGIAARMMIRRAIRRAEKKEAKEHNQSGE